MPRTKASAPNPAETVPPPVLDNPLDGQRWPAAEVEMVPTDGLMPYARNARTHSDEQIAQIMASIREWGFTTPILRDETGMVIAGHGRLMAAQRLKLAAVPVVTAYGWSEAKNRAYVIADNKLALNAGWDEEMLALELGDLAALDVDMDLIGFSENELAALLASADGEGAGGERKASVLAALDVSIADPRHAVKTGDVWHLGDRHVLICECVLTGWAVWSAYLTEDDAVFCPFPGPFVPLSMKADEVPFVMVQPDPYAAGHLLDRYADVHGEEAVTLADD
ncbi:MAG: hypothetical protein EOM21_17195 [Gammaproteobacteria bacterium]|nr:hypothetical protein [Gammaproteobacteria bacterium]